MVWADLLNYTLTDRRPQQYLKALKQNKMPLKQAKGNSKKAQSQAVSANIRELKKSSSKQRPFKQVLAIALSAARGKGK